MSNSYNSVCSRFHSSVILVLIINLLIGCGTSGDENAIDLTAKASAVAGTATLLPSVKTIPLTKGQFIASEAGNKWKLRARGSERVGDVLLLDDAAVKVVSTDSEQMTLTVTEAEIEDVFSKLSFEQKFNQSSGVFIPDPKSSVPVTVGPSTKATGFTAFVIDDTTSSSLKIPFNSPPWVANLELQFEGKVKFDYESRNKAATTGALDVSGTLGGDAGFVADAKVDLGYKKPLGTIRIPIPLGIADGIGRILNIRVASIVIPVTLGLKAQVEAGITLQLQGSVQGKFTTTYDTVNGLSAPGPTLQGTLTANGLPSASTPAAPVKGSLQIGPYIHLAPQLVILNKVATLGVDATMGLYGKGTLQAMVVSPYYCITVDPVLQADAFGFFRHVFLAKPLKTPEVQNELKVGQTWLYPVGTACNSVQFSAATYSASQSDNSAGILVLRNGDTSTSATVKYATSDGTALAGRDYTATSGTLSFSANDQSKTINVPILNNSSSQGGTVKLALSEPSADMALGTPSTATLTIEQKGSQCTDPFPAVSGALSVNGESKPYSHVGGVSESISTTISSASANGGKGSASLSTQFQNGPGDVVQASLNFVETILVSSTTNAGQLGTATFVPSTSATGSATCTVNDDGGVLSVASGGGLIELLGVQPMVDWLVWRRESCPSHTGDGNGGVPGVVNFVYGRPFDIEVRMIAFSHGSNHPNLTTASASGSVSLAYSTASFQINDRPSDARVEFCRTTP